MGPPFLVGDSNLFDEFSLVVEFAPVADCVGGDAGEAGDFGVGPVGVEE